MSAANTRERSRGSSGPRRGFGLAKVRLSTEWRVRLVPHERKCLAT